MVETWELTTQSSATQTDGVPSGNNKTEHLTGNRPDFPKSDVNKHYEDIVTAMSTCYANPQSLKEAMECPNTWQWQEAANIKMKIHFENRT